MENALLLTGSKFAHGYFLIVLPPDKAQVHLVKGGPTLVSDFPAHHVGMPNKNSNDIEDKNPKHYLQDPPSARKSGFLGSMVPLRITKLAYDFRRTREFGAEHGPTHAARTMDHLRWGSAAR